MPYRFTATEKWHKAWFTGLSPWSKLVFAYLCDQCDIAGFYELNVPLMSVQTGLAPAQIDKALDGLTAIFRGEQKVVRCGDVFWLVKFILHQRNWPLNESNPAHRGILKSLEKHSVVFGCDLRKSLETNNLPSPLQAPSMALDRVIGKGKGNGKGVRGVGEGGIPEAFEAAQKLYPGRKRGAPTEFEDFKRKHKDWRDVVDCLQPALKILIAEREKNLRENKFVPPWKNFKTWLYNRCWEEALNADV